MSWSTAFIDGYSGPHGACYTGTSSAPRWPRLTRGAWWQVSGGTRCIHGEEVAVNAEVASLPELSAHANAQQSVQWPVTVQAAVQRVSPTLIQALPVR